MISLVMTTRRICQTLHCNSHEREKAKKNQTLTLKEACPSRRQLPEFLTGEESEQIYHLLPVPQ